MDCTSSFFEKINGSSATPTLRDFVVKNGDLLKAGSSAMETSETVTPPERIERLISPTLTWRPNAVVICVSSVGLNWLALMKSGRQRTIKNNTTMTPPTIMRGFFFMASLQSELPATRPGRGLARRPVRGGPSYSPAAICNNHMLISVARTTGAVAVRTKCRASLHAFPDSNAKSRATNSLGLRPKPCYVGLAFVALVTPLDSIEGAASSHLQPLSLYGWRRSRSTNSLKRRKYISERTRNSKVVQCQQGFWIHPAPVRRGRFRPFFRDSGGRI